MERPLALWTLLLAFLPWLLLLRPPRTRIKRALFPALFLLSSPNARKRRNRKRVLRAATRSLAIVALAILWAAPSSPRPKSLETPDVPHADADVLDSVLIVDGADSAPARDDAPSPARVLELALASQRDERRLRRVSSLEFLERPDVPLRGRDAALIVDLPSLEPREENALAAFVQSGGAVVIWPGAHSQPTRWNETLKRWNIDATVVDAPLNDAPAVSDSPRERAFLNAFPDARGAAIDALPCDRAIVVVGPGAEPVLRDRKTRAPLFSRLSNGVCWFAAPPDARFGAIAALPAFPALVDATTRYPRETPELTDNAAPLSRWRAALLPLLWSIIIAAAFVELEPLAALRWRRSPAL